MDILDLIKKVGGVKALGVQFIDQTVINFKRMKDHNRITFVTEEDFGLKGTEKFGVVIWMDREKAKQAFIEAREHNAD
jgi:hypothetical protein